MKYIETGERTIVQPRLDSIKPVKPALPSSRHSLYIRYSSWRKAVVDRSSLIDQRFVQTNESIKQLENSLKRVDIGYREV